VGQLHQLVHADILLCVEGDLEEVEDDLVDPHVPQQPLFVLPRLQNAH
jgi:hypothetical protein